MSAALISVFATPPPMRSKFGAPLRKLRSTSLSTRRPPSTRSTDQPPTIPNVATAAAAGYRSRRRELHAAANEAHNVIAVDAVANNRFYTNGLHKCSLVLGWHIVEHVSLLDWIGMYILGERAATAVTFTHVPLQARRTRSTIWT